MNYYSEFDPKTAAWLRELIKSGLIPKGEVDERSIIDVRAGDLRDFTQCHFFAGIGGWSYALRLAGWSDSRHCWTGSCPCQPFSGAGKGLGEADLRHLWPAWFNLIRECHPSIIFGEQVASPLALAWIDGVFSDLESQDYACGAADLCAAGVRAPHIRQRLNWVAESEHAKRRAIGIDRENARREETHSESRTRGEVQRLADSEFKRRQQQPLLESPGIQHQAIEHAERAQPVSGHGASVGGMGNSELPGSQGRNCRELSECGSEQTAREGVSPRGLEHTASDGREQRRTEPGGRGIVSGCVDGGMAEPDGRKSSNGELQRSGEHSERNKDGCTGFWDDANWHECRDGKSRRISPKPALFPLAPRIPGRVGLLRGAGNAICPQVSAEFVKAYLETITP
jgi:DNA (cytosine-5)-methyltransferase 1